jgi:hypothetical protein
MVLTCLGMWGLAAWWTFRGFRRARLLAYPLKNVIPAAIATGLLFAGSFCFWLSSNVLDGGFTWQWRERMDAARADMPCVWSMKYYADGHQGQWRRMLRRC